MTIIIKTIYGNNGGINANSITDLKFQNSIKNQNLYTMHFTNRWISNGIIHGEFTDNTMFNVKKVAGIIKHYRKIARNNDWKKNNNIISIDILFIKNNRNK